MLGHGHAVPAAARFAERTLIEKDSTATGAERAAYYIGKGVDPAKESSAAVVTKDKLFGRN